MLQQGWPRRGGPYSLATAALVLILAALAVTACAPGGNVVTTPAGPAESGAPQASDVVDGLAINPQQRAYLNALADAGVHPSSDLMALSIGSYICQAVDAGQSAQAVRDFVLPMVRGDYHDSHPDVAVTSMKSQVDDVTDVYVRTATHELC